MMKDFLPSLKIKILQVTLIILLFQQLNTDGSSNCVGITSFDETNCFTNLIKLEQCVNGQFAEDKFGNMFILYSARLSDENNRLLYALKKDGTIYFPNDDTNNNPNDAAKPFKISASDARANKREHSRVIFLNSGNSANQYLLSISPGEPGNAITELYEIGKNADNKNTIITKSAEATSTFDDSLSGLSSSFQYSLLKIPNQNKYFFTFAKDGEITTIKFTFNSFNLGEYPQIDDDISLTSNNCDNEIISCFIMNERNLLVLFYLEKDNNNYDNYGNYSRKIYDYDLNIKGEETMPAEFEPVEDDNVFFKGIHIKGDYSAFIYSIHDYDYGFSEVRLNISKLINAGGRYRFDTTILKSFSDHSIINDRISNDFIKINEKRLAFITTESDGEGNKLLFVLIDIDGEDYQDVTIKYYSYYFSENINEMSAYSYNEFLVLSLSNRNSDENTYSLLAFFGYPNGTDTTMDYNEFQKVLNQIPIQDNDENNIYNILNSLKKVENNIFGYEEVNQIKLISIPREIRFYQASEDGNEIIGSPLSANSLFGKNHVLKENRFLIRTLNHYYSLEYQYIVKEPANSGEDDGSRRNLRNNEESDSSSKYYYGRINKLSFILCQTEPLCESECNFENYLNNECQIEGTDSEAVQTARTIIRSYDDYSKILSVGLSQGTFVEITNEKKDKLLDNDGNLAKIDLGECGEKIRESLRGSTEGYTNQPLIILKYGVSSNVIYENYVVYEIYNPITHAKIDISEICANLNVGVYIDTKMSESVSKSVEEMVDQGYNPFDPNDKFYREICTPYDSPDGTDVLLDQREEYFLSNLNTIACADNCKTSSYPLDSRYLKCDCPVENEVTLDIKHFSGDNVVKSFKSTLKNSNWRAMNCYKLVFDKDIFGKNAGSILTLILFIIYVGFFVYYIFEGITPLQDTVAGMMSEADDNKEEAEKNAQDKEKSPAVISFKNPPKKSNSENEDNKDKKSSGTILDKKENDIQIVSEGSDKKERASVTDKDLSKIHIKKDSIYTEEVNLYRRKETEKEDNEEKYKDLDDFQLNNLEYVEACKYDKRTFLKTYWSVLKREHIILFTFVSRNDHNLFYVKIERFIFLLCTQLFMNGLFFIDDSMHKTTKSKDYNFGQQLPKIIFSLICTHVIEVFLCYLSMTDTVIYEIKDLSKRKHTEQIIAEKINTMKKKLIAYFIVTLVLFIFYWYFVSAFCAVFQNTQKAYLLDFLIGTIIGFADPFIIYLLKVALRYLSLAKLKDRKGAIVYKISDLIPIF